MSTPVKICLANEWYGKIDIGSSKDREIIAKSVYLGGYKKNLINRDNPQLAERISTLEKDINEWLESKSNLHF
jgi:hypothetical protein